MQGGIFMALSLRRIFQETRHRYHLELVCGEEGLDNIMSWVYISEDIHTSDFLQGGELIITTGVSGHQSSSWLSRLICTLIAHNTCGLILNIGPYIKREDISDEILSLCKQANFPLFVMPWNIRIADITHDYYERIFRDTQTETAITDAFQELLFCRNAEHGLAVLQSNGFPDTLTYEICCLRYESAPSLFFPVLKRQLKTLHPSFHLCRMEQNLLIIAPGIPQDQMISAVTSMEEDLLARFPNLLLYAGIGSTAASLSELSRSYFQAKAAAAMAAHSKCSLYCFDHMGFFKILFSVNDRRVLESYVHEKLGVLIENDQTHHTGYMDTLHQYLICGGSIQKIAAALFCHRNTISYRIRIIKEEFGYDLDDGHACFELTAAFEILEYLRILR